MIPYGRQTIEAADVEAVARALRAERITQGPRVAEFEAALAARTGARHAVAFSHGTAALHAMCVAAGVGAGDEVVTTPLSFVATANAIVMAGGRPVLADVEEAFGTLDPAEAARRIGPRTRAILAVDYAGHPCDYEALGSLAAARGIPLLVDACHSLGAEWEIGSSAGAGAQGPAAGAGLAPADGRSSPAPPPGGEGRGNWLAVGSGRLAAMSAFSFHPVKAITTGEGGAVTTDDPDLARRLRRIRDHGLAREAAEWERPEEAGGWYYEMQELGWNYRITDIQCALGISQIARLDRFLSRRREIAARYGERLAGIPGLRLPAERAGCRSAWHLYVIRLAGGAPVRRRLFDALRAAGIGVQVHYVPVHLHPYYRRLLGAGRGACPRAEAFYDACLSLPIFPSLSAGEQDRVAGAVRAALAGAGAQA